MTRRAPRLLPLDHVSSTDVVIDWTGYDCLVSWRYCDGPWIVAACSVEFEPADRSVGVSAGWLVEGDWVPASVEALIAEAASAEADEDYEDAAYSACDDDGPRSWRGGL